MPEGDIGLPAPLLARLEMDTGEAEAQAGRLANLPSGVSLAQVLEMLARGARPERTLRTAGMLAEAQPDAWASIAADETALHRFAIGSGASDALGELLIRLAEARAVLMGTLGRWSVEDVRDEGLKGLASGADPSGSLARTQRLGVLRIAMRDLLGMIDTPSAAAELADLAEGIIQAALRHVRAQRATEARLAIIGMGKLGGRELNYVSDVDLLFVSDGGEDAAGIVSGLMTLLGTVTPEGRAYEIDTNLRPEGRDGSLVRSIDAYRTYYERWARTWEFQALLKARPIAGDQELGEQFRELAEQHVWPDRLDGAAVAEIQRMKRVVEGSARVRKAGAREVKLAPGGLRDIEFAVQLLQLVHGRHDHGLRSPNTLDALHALATGGYVDEGDANLFSDAYQFLRTVEHRIQLGRLRRSHVIPADGADRRDLARACGFRDIRVADALEQFDRELARVRAYVRRLHEKLFYRPLLDRFAELTRRDQEPFRTGGGLDETAAQERLTALGFRAPQRAVEHLRALATGTSRLTQLMRMVLPAVLPVLAATPDPDEGLVGFRTLAERLRHNPTFQHTLRDAPPAAETLADVLGRSRRVGEWLGREPDLIGRLEDPEALERPVDSVATRRHLERLLAGRRDAEGIPSTLRRLTRREVAWTAMRELTSKAGVSEVASQLTSLAEVGLATGIDIVTADTPLRLAAIGLGKLGAGQLGYASDLDIMLVFEPPDERDAALQAAERLISLLSESEPEPGAFRADLDLRPEGRDGPLARTLDSYVTYYERWASSWEFLALTQARVVAGDRDLGQRLLDAITPLVFEHPASERRLADVRQMKARVERERAGQRAGTVRRSRPARTDLKLGPGGLADIEWTAQLLQLQHGGAHAELRKPGVVAALEAASPLGLLANQDRRWLEEGWAFLTSLRNALYLSGIRESDLMPARPSSQAHVAQVLGYEPPGIQQLNEDLTRVMRRVRRVHERVFYGS